MATITYTRPSITPLPNGGRQVEWEVIMADVGVADEIELDGTNGFHTPCDLVLIEATLAPLGLASSIQVETGITTGFVLQSNDGIAKASVAEVHNRLQADGNGDKIEIPARAKKLVLRPVPNIATGGAGQVKFNVTIRIPAR